jgi:hypothetical protein
VLAPQTTQVPIAHVIGKDDQDVRRRRAGDPRQDRECEDDNDERRSERHFERMTSRNTDEKGIRQG